MVGFKANQICTLPAAALPPLLRWLILTDNQLEEVPAEIGRCSRLQKLMLAGNRLRALPQTLVACTQLELLRIAANELTELPTWLLDMPRLSWLAYAGNPFVAPAEAAAEVALSTPPIPWEALTVEQQLGEGASGVISEACWQQAGAPAAKVAVKVFKGALTSDGLPRSEMAACMVAGTHPNLIAVEIAAAAEHLHARSILHGDLYAHNTLVKSDGSSLLGDFGAASFFTGIEPEKTRALQQLETRAFSCMLEELLQRCVPQPPEEAALAELWTLQERCGLATVALRPMFSEVRQELQRIQQTVIQQAPRQ
jgi:hypothetical protein